MKKIFKGIVDSINTLFDIIVTFISALQHYSHFLLYDAQLRKIETLKKSRDLSENNSQLESIIRDEAEKSRGSLRKDFKRFMFMVTPIIIFLIIIL